MTTKSILGVCCLAACARMAALPAAGQPAPLPSPAAPPRAEASPTPTLLPGPSPSPVPSPSTSPSPAPSTLPSPAPSASPYVSAVLRDYVQQYQELSWGENYRSAVVVAQRAAEASQFLPGVSVTQKADVYTDLANFYYRTGSFDKASAVARQVVKLRRSSGDQVALAGSLIDLSTLQNLNGRTTLADKAAQQAENLLTSRSLPTDRNSALGPTDIIADYLDFFEGSVPGGYGRYTYVLFPLKNDRAVQFMQTLADQVATTAGGNGNRLGANLFEFPVLSGKRLSARSAIHGGPVGGLTGPQRTAEFYDYDAANKRIYNACLRYRSLQDKFCNAAGQGPYLVVYGHPAAIDEITKPYLIIDLSSVKQPAFRHFIGKIETQVAKSEFTKDQGLHSIADALVTIVLTAADWIDPTIQGIGKIFKLVK